MKGKVLVMKSKPLKFDNYSTIDCGEFQSPIEIQPNCAIEMQDQGEILLNYDRTFISIDDKEDTIKVHNDASGFAIINGRKFQLSEFHFHVGDKDKEQNESEHVLVGQCYKMELHLVHKSQVGRIAVLSVFFKIGCANSAIQTILDNINKKRGVTNTIDIDIKQLLPHETIYYHYLGSLTTNGFIENVEWYVFEEPIEMSQEQYNIFKTRYSGNVRCIQNLNGRKILKKKIKLFTK
ncbi:carbonic anhydrase family protein [Bacillus sp. SRB1LM]|nr:carbonic anhydrase family protein [Bacillus sp. SRB1LM]